MREIPPMHQLMDPLELLHQQPGYVVGAKHMEVTWWQVHSAQGMVQHLPAHGAQHVLDSAGDGDGCCTAWWHCGTAPEHAGKLSWWWYKCLRGSTVPLCVWWCQDSWMPAAAFSLEIPHLDHQHFTMWHCFCLLWHACYVTAFQVLMCQARSNVITCRWPY